MPKQTLHNALGRQWELLTLIPSKLPGLTVSELRERLIDRGYEVSKRTVARDLEALSMTFPIVSEQRLSTDYFALRPGTHIDLPSMTLAQALSFRLIEDFFRPLLPKSVLAVIEPQFETARQKLEATNKGNPVGALIDKIRAVQPNLPFVPPTSQPGVLETLQEALLANAICEIDYLAADASEPTRLLLKPLSLVQRGAITYLIALAFDYSDPRLYSVHRVRTAKMTEDRFTPPADYSLDSYIRSGRLNFGLGDTLAMVIRVKPHLAKLLLESPLSADMQMQVDDEEIRVSASVPDTWQLQWWLLSMADDLEVIEPVQLRQRICERHEAALQRYQRGAP